MLGPIHACLFLLEVFNGPTDLSDSAGIAHSRSEFQRTWFLLKKTSVYTVGDTIHAMKFYLQQSVHSNEPQLGKSNKQEAKEYIKYLLEVHLLSDQSIDLSH